MTAEGFTVSHPRTYLGHIGNLKNGDLLMPLVLVSNEVNATNDYDWKDITGEQYHYPNQYRNRIKPGERFVYYRGVRRLGGKRGQPEYFGSGLIGDVWRDPEVPVETAKRDWAWFCHIEDYVPFPSPVPAQTNGTFFEEIPSNHWGVGVRELTDSVYGRIIAAAGLSVTEDGGVTDKVVPIMPPFADVVLPASLSVLLAPCSRQEANGSSGGSPRRYSRNSTVIGRRAEEIALAWARRTYPGSDIMWTAESGQMPGWDIEVRHPNGTSTAIEVKGASGAGFASFDLTANELRASRETGERYMVVLVANCLGTQPQIQTITNLGSLIDKGEFGADAIAWCISKRETA